MIYYIFLWYQLVYLSAIFVETYPVPNQQLSHNQAIIRAMHIRYIFHSWLLTLCYPFSFSIVTINSILKKTMILYKSEFVQMNRLSLFLAQRMFLTTIYKKNMATMSLICFIGIFIGSCTLTLISAVMRGFEVTIHEKIQGVHAHLIIDAYGKPINFKVLKKVLENEFPEIAACSPHAERHALIRAHNNTDD